MQATPAKPDQRPAPLPFLPQLCDAMRNTLVRQALKQKDRRFEVCKPSAFGALA